MNPFEAIHAKKRFTHLGVKAKGPAKVKKL